MHGSPAPLYLHPRGRSQKTGPQKAFSSLLCVIPLLPVIRPWRTLRQRYHNTSPLSSSRLLKCLPLAFPSSVKAGPIFVLVTMMSTRPDTERTDLRSSRMETWTSGQGTPLPRHGPPVRSAAAEQEAGCLWSFSLLRPVAEQTRCL